jgi:hypothetical protein
LEREDQAKDHQAHQVETMGCHLVEVEVDHLLVDLHHHREDRQDQEANHHQEAQEEKWEKVPHHQVVEVEVEETKVVDHQDHQEEE